MTDNNIIYEAQLTLKGIEVLQHALRTSPYNDFNIWEARVLIDTYLEDLKFQPTILSQCPTPTSPST